MAVRGPGVAFAGTARAVADGHNCAALGDAVVNLAEIQRRIHASGLD
jgi:hypothetical protein